MRKNTIVIAVAMLVLVLVPSAFGLVNIPIKSEKFSEQVIFEANNIDETTIQITIHPGEFEFGSINTEEGMFTTIKAPNFPFTLVEGEAKLPVIRRMIEIPYGSNPEITVSSISWEYTSLDKLNLPDRIIPAKQ